ncbi:MAG: fibronectin type III domain-containing protein, partial [Flavobacteriales bacterium]
MKKLFASLLIIFGGYTTINAQCDYTINGFDSWGDGWNGASIDVDVAGVVTNFTVAGSSGTISIPSFAGDAVTFTWNTGVYDNEVTFNILAPDGTSLGFFGPSPTIGLFLTNTSNSTCAPPSCLIPTALAATNITATSANLAWTAGGTETAWNIEWGATGFTQGAGTMVTGATVNPHALSGLTANTTYQ